MHNNAKLPPRNYLSLSSKRKITLAAYNQYKVPVLHYDRAMPEHDLFVVLCGEWEITVDGESFTLLPGEAIFLFAGIRHFGTKKCAPGTRTAFIHLSLTDGDSYNVPSPHAESVAIPTKINCKQSPLSLEYFDKIIGSFWTESATKNAELSAYTTLLLLELRIRDAEQSESDKALIDGIIKTVGSNISRFYSADELSSQFFISKRKLIYLFKRFTGYPPHAYQLNMKLDLSRDLISSNPDLTVREVAEKFGFYDEFHFSRLYKAKFNRSPKSKKT